MHGKFDENSLQISRWVFLWKNHENLWIFDWVITESLHRCFLTHGVFWHFALLVVRNAERRAANLYVGQRQRRLYVLPAVMMSLYHDTCSVATWVWRLAFSVAGSTVWNSMPEDMRDPKYTVFCEQLQTGCMETFLFSQYYVQGLKVFYENTLFTFDIDFDIGIARCASTL